MNTHVDVTVSQGILRGVVENNRTGCGKFIAFRGIPYAKPPIGELRFRDPIPAAPWTDVREAFQFGNIAPQIDRPTGEIIGNEDCLYLNVYTPSIHFNFPTMVWIHGGGFIAGGGGCDSYGPDYIIAKEVILVTINFRLGALGFLNLDDEVASGNLGLKDALMALRWVHENISNFGGNPKNVTIFGQDSGGCMVHFLATNPQAEGLFHKAISQSGTAAIPMAFADTEAQKARGFLLVEKLGEHITDPEEAVRFLRTIDAMDILVASLETLTINETRQMVFPFVPTMDFKSLNPFFLEHPATLRCVKVPFIIGFNSCEGSLIGQDTDEETLETLENMNSNFASVIHPKIWPILKSKSLTAEDVRLRYFGDEPVSMKTIANYINLLGDMHFYHGIFKTIRMQLLLGHDSTYVYKFSYQQEFVPKNSDNSELPDVTYPGAIHGEEQFYLFSYPSSVPNFEIPSITQSEREKWMITERMTRMWTDFAKSGNPTRYTDTLIPLKWISQQIGDEYEILIIDKDLRKEKAPKYKLNFFESA